jgi:hypothetical protein
MNDKKKSKPNDFDSLVRNGIDFLENAIAQLDADPKHSVINFYTAVELFLKAPLVKEHWTLVVSGDADRQSYEAGDFVSVSFDEACKRLSSLLKKPIGNGAKKAFDVVRQHRNRMVHFFHTGVDGNQKDQIKLEQAQAWFELNRFVTDVWREEFSAFSSEFRRMEHGLIENNHYAKAKYGHLKPKIEGMKKGGAIFKTCPRCQTEAYKITSPTSGLTSHNCLVCFNANTTLEIACPECKCKQQVQPYDGFSCNQCDYTAPSDSMFDLIDQSSTRYTKDDMDANTPANCDECQGYHSVCEYEGGYLCASCFAFFNSLGSCGWCNEPRTSDDENSYVTGCEFCDGYAGHHADD